jgi:predicted nucleic acid-binding protein
MDADGAVVCDASVFAALVFGEPGSDKARSLTRGRRLYAPTLLRYEVAQVATRKATETPSAAPIVDKAFAAGLHVPVKLLEPSWPALVELARTHSLTAYDAAYLQVALALGIRLATLDKRLGQVARELGIQAQPQTG